LKTKNLLLVLAAAVLIVGAVVADRQWMKKGTKAANLPPAPNFTLKDLQGHDVSLEQYRGKVVLVNFWATWCGPCEVEIPWFIEFQRKYGPQGFTVLGLSMDEEGESVVAPWIEKMKFDVNGTPTALNYPILLANDETAGKFGGLIGLPTSILISRDGKIIKRFIGLVSHEKYVKSIEENLN